jgi:hypothetical protein
VAVSLAALLGTGSLITGMFSARTHKYVLLWVLPLFLLALAGVSEALIFWVIVPAGTQVALIPAGKQDDAAALLGVLLALCSIGVSAAWLGWLLKPCPRRPIGFASSEKAPLARHPP